ncbi:hypothetical protein OIV83_004036 [Microbotryomycetes sp. JL201]|nr:hypothetical protein OIV83_004036 [Microbotryomycetes sp. JL201]
MAPVRAVDPGAPTDLPLPAGPAVGQTVSPTLPRTMPDLPDQLEPQYSQQPSHLASQHQQQHGGAVPSMAGGPAMGTRRGVAVAQAVLGTGGSGSGSSSNVGPTSRKQVVTQFVQADPEAMEGDDDDDDDEPSSRPKKRAKKNSGKASETSASALQQSGESAGLASESGIGGQSGDNAEEKGRRKIEIEYIHKKEKRHITFSKRKAGIMKKAYELATLTGTQVLLLVVSETGIVYTFTTSAFQPLVGSREDGSPSDGQRLIQQCLSVDPNAEGSDYISPPPDGPLLPLPPKAQKRPFEANSSIHGGQIALRARQHRPSNRNKNRPPSVSTPGPVDLSRPSVLQPVEPSLQLPPSPHHMHPMHAPPQHSPTRVDYPSPALPAGRGDHQMQSAQEYAEMMHHRSSISGPSYTHHPGAGYATSSGEYMMPPMHQGHSDRHYRALPPHPSHMHPDAHYPPPHAYEDEYGQHRQSRLPPPPGAVEMYAHPSQQGQQAPVYDEEGYMHRR